MPKYIGVLNVRYSSLVDDNDDSNPIADSITDDKSPLLASKGSRMSSLNLNRGNSTATVVTPTNMVSGIDSPLNLVTPEVTIEDNRHIVPESLWTHYSNSAPSSNILSQPSNSSPLVSQLPSPNLGASDKEFNDVDSLGATTVNRKLQEEVLTEVFAPIREYARHVRSKSNLHTRPIQNFRIPSEDGDGKSPIRSHRYSASATVSPKLTSFTMFSDPSSSISSRMDDGPSSVKSDDIKLHSRTSSNNEYENDGEAPFPDRESFIRTLKNLPQPDNNDNVFMLDDQNDNIETYESQTGLDADSPSNSNILSTLNSLDNMEWKLKSPR
ncbi:unnamed protein product [Ambrosiozyma monospora]|uniref:Unnamed protein product n=1 Tax=Ambrosiozyma monospora TaxID=43982 RepID=A0ACB5U548_AMBMO|nr:unnamed protein product [Ambrosiozyma monospora]